MNDNAPIENPNNFPAWLRKNIHLLYGFFGWYLVNGLIWLLIGNPNENLNIMANLLIFPVNLLATIILSVVKSTRKLGFGILLALGLNLLVSLLLNMTYNGVCFIPFFWK